MAQEPKRPSGERSPLHADVTAATSDHIGTTPGSARPARVPTHVFNPGDTIGGRYRIVSILGTGGMGEVYRADDLTLGASVALKFLPTDLAADPVRLDRFRGEVRLTRQISHANVCRVYDIVEADGRVFLTMEYIDGEDLSSLLRRIGRLPQDKAVEIARQICAGLQAAHDQGVIHRDLKPANVMIDGRGRARIMDFGIAALGDVRGESAIAGTPVYMAPEQLAGREATAKSDIYALGLVLHEVFTGRRAHDAETLADLREIHRASTRPTSLSKYVADIDPAIERAVHRCLEADPADRPMSAITVSASLPGGDPLAAALAAGETPSPELVAAAGSRGGLRQPVAVGLIVVLATIFGSIAAIVPRTDLIAAVNPALPRSVMEQKARDMLREFEGEAEHADEGSGWFQSGAVMDWMKRADSSSTRWAGLPGMWGGPVQFWVRWADAPMVGRSVYYDVEEDDPPRIGAGQRMVRLDSKGHLLRLEIAGSSGVVTVTPPTDAVDEAQIRRAFALAGLDFAAFTPTDERSVSRVEADAHRAWIGPYPGMEGQQIRVGIGFRGGRLCWFRVEHPFELADTKGRNAEEMPEWAEWAVTALVWMIMAGGGVIAWKNIRARRSDVRAGVRAALGIVVAWGIGAVVMRDRIPEVTRVFFGEAPIIAGGIVNAAYFLLFYIALEPTARRVWPSLLVSWIRLTSGRWRDPMVGRDVLIGMVVGAASAGLARIACIAPTWFGAGPGAPLWNSPSALMGLNHVLAFTLWGLAIGTISASTLTLILVMLRVILRSKTPAVIGLVVLWAGLLSLAQLQNHWSAALLTGAVYMVQIALLLRFGFLATAASGVVTFLVGLVPAGYESHGWWASGVVIPGLAMGALAAYGYATSIGDRSGSSPRRSVA